MKRIIIILVSLVIHTNVEANCESDPVNLLNMSNCDFTTYIAPEWSIFAGSISHDMTDDFLGNAPGSVILDAFDGNTSFITALSQCVEITTDTSAKTVGFWVKGNTKKNTECSIRADFYEGDGTGNCNMAIRGTCTSSQVITSTSGWTNLICDTAGLSGNAQTVNILMACANGVNSTMTTTAGDFTVKFDNAYVVPLGNAPVELIEFDID